MPRQRSKTIVTTVAGDGQSLAEARLENLKKAREKALELRLLRTTPSTAPGNTASVENKSRRRVKAEPVSPKPVDAKLVPEMLPAQEAKPRGRPRGSGKRKTPATESGNPSTDTVTADTGGHDGANIPGEILQGGSRTGDAIVTNEAPAPPESPKTPAGNTSVVQVNEPTETVEEGELDATPPPPTELPRGRSKNNRRKPTTVKRTRYSSPTKDTVRRRLQFDHMHVPVGGGAFYRNHHSGHFTFSR
jgi:hypothetical protein